MHNLKKLIIWNKSMELATSVYKVTANYPDDEKFGLTSQIRRSAVSVPSNIAEGAGRESDKDFARFLSIANGSSYELQTQLILSQLLELADESAINPLLDVISEIQKMNYTFQKNLR
jgi:four helix bundle protein